MPKKTKKPKKPKKSRGCNGVGEIITYHPTKKTTRSLLKDVYNPNYSLEKNLEIYEASSQAHQESNWYSKEAQPCPYCKFHKAHCVSKIKKQNDRGDLYFWTCPACKEEWDSDSIQIHMKRKKLDESDELAIWKAEIENFILR